MHWGHVGGMLGAGHRSEGSKSLAMPLAKVRQRKVSNSGCTSLRYKNWVRRGNESGIWIW